MIHITIYDVYSLSCMYVFPIVEKRETPCSCNQSQVVIICHTLVLWTFGRNTPSISTITLSLNIVLKILLRNRYVKTTSNLIETTVTFYSLVFFTTCFFFVGSSLPGFSDLQVCQKFL